MSRVIYVLLALALMPVAASGQVGIAFEFSFSNPGARSMGFGGAFVALADDATAAFANPAGLVQLVQPEVSLEVRHWSYSLPYTYSGRLTGQPTGIGLDTNPDVERRNFDNDVNGVSYLSFIYPRNKWSIAFYRHLLADFALDARTNGLFAFQESAPMNTARLFERHDRTEIEFVTYGLTGAYEVLENLSLGLGLTYFDGLLSATQDLYLWDEDTVEGYFGPSSFLPEKFVSGSDASTSGSDVGFNAGLLWRIVENWNFGAFYRRGPRFDFNFTITAGPAVPDPETPPGSTFSNETVMDFPDVYGAGLAYRSASGRLTLSFEWDRVQYSAIFDSLGETSSGEFIPDGDEYHLGAEYAFLQTQPLFALRAGIWRDPNHQVRSSFDSEILEGLLSFSGDAFHYAIGFGAAFQRFQVDLGADFSDRRDTLSISGIYSW